MESQTFFEHKNSEPPRGWILCGDSSQQYEVFRDREVFHSGTASGGIRFASVDKACGFGTLMQTATPGEYSGKRLRLSGWVKTKDVVSWGGLWLRIDGPEMKMLGFDNMMDRPLTGTLDWARHEIVLDVPSETIALAYGLLLAGTGQAWVDDLVFETVGPEIHVTGPFQNPPPMRPTNLDFEDPE